MLKQHVICFSQLLEPRRFSFLLYKPRQLEARLQKTLKRLSSFSSVRGDQDEAVLDSPASPTRVPPSQESATELAQHLRFVLGFEILPQRPQPV